MAKTRALMTDTERERLAGMADVKDIKVYQAKSRVRRRIEEELTFDIEILEENHPDLLEELREVVCEGVQGEDIGTAKKKPERGTQTPGVASEETGEITPEPTTEPESDLLDEYRDWLEGRSPQKSHAKDLVVDTLRLLREHGTMATGELQDELFPEYNDEYSEKRTMWNSISRYLDELPGFEKADYGEWAYAGDSQVLKVISEGKS